MCSPTRPGAGHHAEPAPAPDARRVPRRPEADEFNPNVGTLLLHLSRSLPARRRERQKPGIGGGLGTLPDPAGIAQSVEQLTRNEQVRSSNLLPGSTQRGSPMSVTSWSSLAGFPNP